MGDRLHHVPPSLRFGRFRAAEERNPNSPKVLYARASAYIESKRKLDEAQALLRRYLELQTTPDDPTPREAAALLKQARSLGPNGRRAEEHQRIQTSCPT